MPSGLFFLLAKSCGATQKVAHSKEQASPLELLIFRSYQCIPFVLEAAALLPARSRPSSLPYMIVGMTGEFSLQSNGT
jgi:hypothetical protein